MRKKPAIIVISVLCVLALFACGLSACKKIPTSVSPDGRVTPVATAMNTIYASMLAADGSKSTNYFTLLFDGTYTADGKVYDYKFGGAFDITQTNRDDDKRTQLYFEVKQGGVEVFLVYYSEGKLYLDFQPYARRAVISDYNFAEVAYAIYSEKENGAVKRVMDSLPSLASRIFDGCRYFNDEGTDRYVFSLSYSLLFDAFSTFVESWDAGFTPAQLLEAFHLDETAINSLTGGGATTTFEFLLKDGAFLSAKANVEGKGALTLDSFSLQSGTAALTLPVALSSFTEFDFRNFALSGTLNLSAENASSDRAINYGVAVNRDFDEVTYAFAYDFKSHYVAGSGLEFDLALTDPNGKNSRFAIRGEYLYADLSAYGVQKLKLKTADLWEKLGTTGFCDTDPYTFRDEMRLITLLIEGRSANGDVVSYSLGSEFFSLLSQKLGFKGLFGVSGATLSWDTANDRLQKLSAKLEIGAMNLSLQASSFTFGTVVALPDVDDAAFVDLGTRESTRLSARGTLASHTSLSTDGRFLSELFSSLSGEEVVFEAEGGVGYTADVVFGGTGALRRVSARFFTARGAEICSVYYTEDTPDEFYLIYPEQAGGIRRVRTLTIAETPFAAFNRALGASESSVGNKIYLVARERAYTIGAQPPMISWIEQKLALLFPDLSLSAFYELNCRRYELKITGDALTGKIVFDGDNDLTVTATSFAVTFNDDVNVTELSAVAPTAPVPLLSDNDMPVYASVRFAGDPNTYKLSLLDYATGEKVWTYSGVPDHLAYFGSALTTTASASATLLGKPLSATLTVDISPATSVLLSGSATYGGKYDVNQKLFRFDLYNDVSPKTALDTFVYLTVTIGSREYIKTVDWDLTGLTTTLVYNGTKRDFTVKPKVKTYFGNEITLGSVADFTVHIDGSKATGAKEIGTNEDFKMVFEAYDGRDPADIAVYSDALNVVTAEGNITVERVDWNLVKMEELKESHPDSLYSYETANLDRPDKVKARVYDLTGNFVELEIPVIFVKHVVEEATFDVSALDGVEYDKTRQKFVFDVLKVRSLSPISTDAVLPRALSANVGTSAAFDVQGLKWEFEPVSGVLNNAGTTGKLTLVIGDEISGHQKITFDYAFTEVEIVKTALLDAEQNVILEKSSDVFEYLFENRNVYDPASYRYPAYLRATYRKGEGEESEILAANWTFDKPFRESDLWAGGDYVLSGSLGSEPVTVSLSFAPQYITGYAFTEAERTISGSVIPLTDKEGKSCLTYSVLTAIGGTSPLHYGLTTGYPVKMKVTTDGEHYYETDVTWDLSAFKAKSDILGVGGIVKVSANAKGQTVEVYVYVAPAVGDGDLVYVDQARTSETLSFRLITPSANGYVVTDPRDPANYPEYLYVTGASSEEYEVKVLSWSGIENVITLFTTGLGAGKAANEIKGETVVKAKIGDEMIGFKEISVPLAIVDSTLENITVSGLPFAASSEQTGGATPYAITPHYIAGATDTFSYELSLDVNPYYVNPVSLSSYPAYVNFELDGVAVRAAANWDLTRIPANAAVDSKTAVYLVYAMIDLTDAFPNVLVPVAVNVLKREIDKVWIRDGSGEWSSQPFLDIDGYAAEPFGKDIEGSVVTLDVKVQFKGDANKYPLKLKYDVVFEDGSSVVLSYDGSGLYEDITVLVGNENGGYQEVGGYSIRVISNIVSRIVLSESDKLGGTDGVFYKASYESLGSDKLVFSYQKVMDMGRELPESISVTFGMGGTPRTVYRSGSALWTGGVVFDWDRNDKGYIGIVLYNPSVAESVSGANQAIYNPEQDDYNAPTAEMFFDEGVWSEVYRDIRDEEGYITVATSIARYESEIKVDRVGATYQTHFVTANYDGAAKIGAETRLDAGVYRLYVEVSGHNHYKGKVYKTFSITPKDITDTVVLLVNGGQRNDGSSADYTGSPFLISAGVGDYPITVPLLVNGSESEPVTNVTYQAAEGGGYEEAYYTFFVSVDPIAVNYYVVGKVLRFKVLDVPFADPLESVAVSLPWNSRESTFYVGVTVDGIDLTEGIDDPTRGGYEVAFYETSTSRDPVTTFTAGNRYYYRIKVKVPNHTLYYPENWVSAK